MDWGFCWLLYVGYCFDEAIIINVSFAIEVEFDIAAFVWIEVYFALVGGDEVAVGGVDVDYPVEATIDIALKINATSWAAGAARASRDHC